MSSFDGDYTGDSDAANLYDDDPVGMSNDDSADAYEQNDQTVDSVVAKEGLNEEEE